MIPDTPHPPCCRIELPRTLQVVANLLRQRLQRIRDDARAVLVSMAVELGPYYLPYICRVLQAALPDKGFTAHVVGYTAHAVLEGLAKGSGGQHGGLDASVELLLPILDAELFGEVAEAKEYSNFAAAYKEAKKCRAYESYQLLAAGITFDQSIDHVLGLVKVRLHEAGTPKVRAKLSQLLQFAARGVQANATAGPHELLLFVHSTLEEGLAAEEAARERAKQAAGAAVQQADTANGADEEASRARAHKEAAALHHHLLLEFALSLLNTGVKKGPLAGRSPELLGMLSPLLPLLVRALACRHSACVSLALKCLSFLVHQPLPGLEQAAADAGKAVTSLLKKVPSATHPIAQECFRLLAGMLRECEAYKPTVAQLRFLLRWTSVDMEESAEMATSFSLLRAILGRKVVVPEVYDVMARWGAAEGV